MALTPAYIAGVLDADGSIGFNRGAVRLTVTNMSEPLMLALLATMGGSYHRHQRLCEDGCERAHVHVWNQAFGWSLGGERAAVVLRVCLPFLVVKTQAARDALDMWQVSVVAMERPSVRTGAMRRARAEMALLGWVDPEAPEVPEDRCKYGHVRVPGEPCVPCRQRLQREFYARQAAA